MSTESPPEPPRWRRRLRLAFALDLRSLAAFRVGLGMLLLYDLGNRLQDLSAHYTDEGVLPIDLVPAPEFGSKLTSLHLLSGAWGWQVSLFAVAAAFAVMLLVGWKTRLATFASWVLLGSLHARNPLICYEADVFLGLLLLWALFLPLDARWSLARRGQGPEATPQRRVSVGTAGLLLQVCFVYWFAAISKSGPTWFDGTAAIYAMNVDQYSTDLGKLLLEFPALLSGLTTYTLIVEWGAPFLLIAPWERARLVGLLLIASLQVGFFACMDLGIFPATSLLALVPLVPGLVWDRLLRRAERAAASPEAVHEEPWTRRSALAGLTLFGVFAWNVTVLGDRRLNAALPEWVREAARVLQVDQRWSMFAPDPMTEDGWFVVSAYMEDGSLIDLLSGAPLDWQKPDDVSGTFPSDRWKEFLMTAYDRDPYEGYWRRYVDLSAKEWRRAHPGGPRPVSVSVVYVLETTLPDLTLAPPKPVYVWTSRPR